MPVWGLYAVFAFYFLLPAVRWIFYQETVNGRLEKVVVGEAKEVETISADRFAYQQLSAEEQTVYDQILDCIQHHTDCVTVSTKDQDVLDKAYRCVMADYGGLSGHPVTSTTPIPVLIR